MMFAPAPEALAALAGQGWANLGPALSAAACASVAALDGEETAFRSRIIMSRHGYGEGRYGYFADPLPDTVRSLRERAYPALSGIANLWAERLGQERRYPDKLAAFTAECHAAGQRRPTPLLLSYGPGGHNRLHQDLYGPLVFPIQLVVLLDRPGVDFEGGELVLTTSEPRRQSRAIVVPIAQGEAVAFAVRERPAPGARGWRRVQMRHGVSDVRCGLRRTLGIIFHDAA